jgi:hypothetical protein
MSRMNTPYTVDTTGSLDSLGRNATGSMNIGGSSYGSGESRSGDVLESLLVFMQALNESELKALIEIGPFIAARALAIKRGGARGQIRRSRPSQNRRKRSRRRKRSKRKRSRSRSRSRRSRSRKQGRK